MEDLPDDVIISNIDTFRNIIKQQKNYVDEMQIHLSNKDKVIEGLQQTIRLLESTIESNQELIEKLRTKENESSINNEHRIYDITNELHILEQLDEKEQIITEMLITYIPREQYMKEIKNKEQIINEMHDTYIPKEQYTSITDKLTSLTDKHALELTSLTDKHALELAMVKEQCALELTSLTDKHALELATLTDKHALELASLKEQCALDIAIVKDQHKEKIFTNSSSIKDKIKKKYIKKELEIYKNENIALKNQIEFFKHIVMMNSIYNHYHQPPYTPPYTPHDPKPSYTPYTPPYTPYTPYTPQTPHDPKEPHRTNVKITEQTKSNNENQHKNKMGNVLEQLQQVQKQKQIQQ
jgi:hypothetical protein